MLQERALDGLSVLVVEDEYSIADDLKRLLKEQGAARVLLSGQLEDAAEQIERDGFEIALLDINIHGERIYGLADELARRQIAFAFVTGYNHGEVPSRFADVPFWGKPLDERRIIEDVRKLWKSALPLRS